MSLLNSKSKFKKFAFMYAFVSTSIFTAAVNSKANAITVDLETQNLIIDSISMELVKNSALKDPVDGLPLGLDYSSIEILGQSIEVDFDNSSTLTTYQVSAPFETIDGQGGTILCSAFIKESNVEKSAEKANCYISEPMYPDDGSSDDLIDEDQGI